MFRGPARGASRARRGPKTLLSTRIQTSAAVVRIRMPQAFNADEDVVGVVDQLADAVFELPRLTWPTRKPYARSAPNVVPPVDQLAFQKRSVCEQRAHPLGLDLLSI